MKTLKSQEGIEMDRIRFQGPDSRSKHTIIFLVKHPKFLVKQSYNVF